MSDDFFEGMAYGAAIMCVVGLWVIWAMQPPPHSTKGDRLLPPILSYQRALV